MENLTNSCSGDTCCHKCNSEKPKEKKIDRFMNKIGLYFIGVSPDELLEPFTRMDIYNICRKLYEEVKNED